MNIWCTHMVMIYNHIKSIHILDCHIWLAWDGIWNMELNCNDPKIFTKARFHLMHRLPWRFCLTLNIFNCHCVPSWLQLWNVGSFLPCLASVAPSRAKDLYIEVIFTFISWAQMLKDYHYASIPPIFIDLTLVSNMHLPDHAICMFWMR